MSRLVRDANLETRTARARLAAQGKPYYRAVEPGLHLGYRKPKAGAGKWVVRHYDGAKSYTLEAIATADDFSDADGFAILDYRQALAKARGRLVDRAASANGEEDRTRGPLTVAMVMDDYIKFLEANRRTAADAKYRDAAFIRPKLGDLEVVALTTDKIRNWHSDMVKSAPRLRTKKGQAQKFRAIEDGEDQRRARRASANRTLTTLKAALNRKWRDGKIKSDSAWRRVEPFEDVEVSKMRYLSVVEARRFINSSTGEYRDLVRGALETGARYGELGAFVVSDFNADAGTLAVRRSKSGRVRHVVLTDDGIEFFRSKCAGRSSSDLIFKNIDGTPWRKSQQHRPTKAACKAAKISPAIGFHALRHTWASLAIMNGVPLLVVARNLGHSDTRMVEKHYGHLAPSYIADAIRAGAPRFGVKADKIAAFATRPAQ